MGLPIDTPFGTATVSEAKRPAVPAPGRWVVTLLHYWPPTLNSLIGRDWTVVHGIKKRDKERVAGELAVAGVPVATGKRRVSLRIVLGPKQKAPDPDAFWKCLLDSLVACGRLTTDSRFGVELGPVSFERGKDRATILTLEDITE